MPVRKKRKTTKRTKRTIKRKSTTKRKSMARKAAGRRKTTVRKAAGRRKTTRRKVTTTKASAIRAAYNKSQILNEIAEGTELSKKQVLAVFEELGNLMHRHLKKGGAREFTIPGLVKCVVKHKKATKARKGINPFTGEPTTFKAKPSRDIVKVRPLKKLKEMTQ